MQIPVNGMQISTNTTFQPGVFYLPDGITIAADGIELNGNGAVLVGKDRAGRGLTIENCRGVKVTNLHIQNYHHGIFAHRCRDLEISTCQITATAEIPPNTVFLDIWSPPDHAHGGGILLWEVNDSQVISNDLQHQMCGLLTYMCSRLTVSANLANYCSGWGIHLYQTSDSLFEANYADYCCRYEPRGVRTGHIGADAAGFLIVHKSCRNIFRGNSARLGGDGFFLAGMTPEYDPAGCDDNLFEANDGSYSPNVAFEGTFSRGNIYRKNIADHSNYGFWLGFSKDCVLEENRISGNSQAGIAVENGTGFEVLHNNIQANTHGILLWSKHIPSFDRAVPDNSTSYNWTITENSFSGNRKAIRIAANQDHGIRALTPTGELGYPTSQPHHHEIRRNIILDNQIGIELLNVVGTTIAENRFERNIQSDVIERKGETAISSGS